MDYIGPNAVLATTAGGEGAPSLRRADCEFPGPRLDPAASRPGRRPAPAGTIGTRRKMRCALRGRARGAGECRYPAISPERLGSRGLPGAPRGAVLGAQG